VCRILVPWPSRPAGGENSKLLRICVGALLAYDTGMPRRVGDVAKTFDALRQPLHKLFNLGDGESDRLVIFATHFAKDADLDLRVGPAGGDGDSTSDTVPRLTLEAGRLTASIVFDPRYRHRQLLLV
jgi:hypothetical protein